MPSPFVCTILTPGPDDDFMWLSEIEAPRKPFPNSTWDTDRDEDPLPPAKFNFKPYEMKLLAALGHASVVSRPSLTYP